MTDFSDFLPDVEVATCGLDVVRLGETPTLIALFTTKIGKCETHFVNTLNLRSEIQCNTPHAGRCLLCDLKHPRTERAILPVFDVMADAIKALLITSNKNPNALAPQIKAELNKGNLANRVLSITRASNKFTVASVEITNGQRMGETAISSFATKLAAGDVDLNRVIPIVTNEALLDVPEFERAVQAFGLDRAEYINTQTA